LVWLYARNRHVALILFSFSFTMMVTFAVQTAAASNDPLLSAIGDSSIALSMPLFSVLLLLFPRDYLSSSLQSGREPEDNHQPGRHHYSILLLRCYLAALAFLSIAVALYTTILYLLPWWQLPRWVSTIQLSYYTIVLIGILVT